jgi:hypothetical protein
MEQANTRMLLAASGGKYDVSRTLPSSGPVTLGEPAAGIRAALPSAA